MVDPQRLCMLIPAAGSGERMQCGTRKPFLRLGPAPVLFHTLARLRSASPCAPVILAVHPGDLETAQSRYATVLKENFSVERIIAGGASRQQTVAAMLRCLPPDCNRVLIHDGARPLVRPAMVEQMLQQTAKGTLDGLIAAVPANATVKEVEDGVIKATPPRERLWMAQTPQIFSARVIKKAFERAADENWTSTDDAGLVERCGYKVAIFRGNHDNIKVTHPGDLGVAEAIWVHQKKQGVVSRDILKLASPQ